MKQRLTRRAILIVAGAGALSLATWFAIFALREQRFDGNLEKIITFLALTDQSKPEQRFDAVRRFVHSNSRHAADEEFERVRGHKNLVAEGLLAYATGKRSEPIHLLCGARSNMMSAILRKLGYETRIIALFDTDHEQLRAHTFLEVRNPADGKWETQDPDYDVYWTSKRSGGRVSLVGSAENLSDLEPCQRSGACGWKLADPKGKLARVIPNYVDIICVTENDNRLCRFTTRAKPDRTFVWNGKSGHFCNLMPHRCPLKPVSETLEDDVRR